jgi:hypothetical protein
MGSFYKLEDRDRTGSPAHSAERLRRFRGALSTVLLFMRGVILYVPKMCSGGSLEHRHHFASGMQVALLKSEQTTSATIDAGRRRARSALTSLFTSRANHSSTSHSVTAHADMHQSASNPAFVMQELTSSAREGNSRASVNAMDRTVHGAILRTRFSFHGVEEDELNVPAGTALVAIEKNDYWYLCQDEHTGRFGLIPISYVTLMY